MTIIRVSITKKIITGIIFFLISFLSFSQQTQKYKITPENADCSCAILISDTIFGPTNAPKGSGKEIEFSGDKTSLYEFEKKHNAVWYYFKAPVTGELTFEIIPINPKDDYDFILYKSTGANFCEDIKLKKVTPVRTCISRTDISISGKTGLSYDAVDNFVSQGPGSSFSKFINVKKGEVYYLAVDNVYPNGKGHTIVLHYKAKVEKPIVKANNKKATPAKPVVSTEPEKATISINIVDKKTGSLIKSNVKIYQKKHKLGKPLYSYDSVSSCTASLTVSSNYTLKVSALGFFEYTKDIKITTKDESIIIKAELDKIEVGQNVIFDNILFIGNQAKFTNESFPVLEALAATLKLNPNLEIEIDGHVNCPKNMYDCEKMEDFNYKLSVARAKAVFDYLIEQGIEKTRLSYKGFGSSQMLYPDAKSEEKMRLNRRVEIVVKSND